jgi:hypothetical protein
MTYDVDIGRYIGAFDAYGVWPISMRRNAKNSKTFYFYFIVIIKGP